MSVESREEIPNAFEEFCEDFFTRCNTLGSLYDFQRETIRTSKQMITYRQEDANACEDHIRRRKYLQNIHERSGLH